MKMYVRKPSESPLSLISETLCKDVFRVKLFKPLFAQHLLQEALRHDALFQPSNLHISVTNQTDKEAKLAMKIGPNYWHCINSEGELMASAKFYISYLIGNNKSSPWKSHHHCQEFCIWKWIHGIRIDIDKVKIILPLNDEVGEK